ncbi:MULTISPECIES: ATP-binding protein [Stappiaceae]|jgi:signal transduction histidine kinase|uniref:ATP-binding protein n=1 Tax=Stappiaceae TaxID=2821832 RepID=UPI00094B384C|nr:MULTISPECIES: ATP-binding protein [Stappiaceae]MBO9463185.1 HAMP domain-containing protein [Labrenzia sp. R5_0]UES53855.1 HAMP domain-containing protein [Roseibium aggregatum]UFI06804.1 HAMP domain-containing protein [Roseibium aggregatum]
MIKWPFNTLIVQLTLLVIAALTAAQVISLWLFADERSLAIRAALGFEAAGRAANVARLLESTPSELRPAILGAADSPLVRFDVSTKPEVSVSDYSDGGVIEARVRKLLGDGYSKDIRVELRQIEGKILPLPHLSAEMAEMHKAMMRGELSAVEMNLSIALSEGQWLNVGTRFERPPLQWPFFATLTFALTAALILMVVFWFLLARLTGPLRRLVSAADKLGRGEEVSELPVAGPLEVKNLTRAFNQMQDRLTRFVADRTKLLASLGHDLKSPLTAMRVRAEMVDDEETRTSLVACVEEMQSMVESTITFARGLIGSENTQLIEVGETLSSLQKNVVEPFSFEKDREVHIRVRPLAFRRALRNLIENALRYGGNARVNYEVQDQTLLVSIEDDGPGIPEVQLEQVFEPFFRLEESRSLETGGHGLGLSISRTIARSHGGDISLSNREGKGLVAQLRIPLSEDSLTPELKESAGNAGFVKTGC